MWNAIATVRQRLFEQRRLRKGVSKLVLKGLVCVQYGDAARDFLLVRCTASEIDQQGVICEKRQALGPRGPDYRFVSIFGHFKIFR